MKENFSSFFSISLLLHSLSSKTLLIFMAQLRRRTVLHILIKNELSNKQHPEM